MWTCKTALLLAPHTDDVEFGAGGLICRLLESQAMVYSVSFSNAWRSLPPTMPQDTLLREVKESHLRLGIPEANLAVLDFPVRDFYSQRQQILEYMVRRRQELNPDLVLVPATTDVHQDHEVICQEAIRAFKTTSLLGYELPWNTFHFHASALVPLKSTHVKRKLHALEAYHSQAHRPYADPEFVKGWMRGRGVTAGTDYAEAYEVIRWVL
jgi:LmbE family N-acetylglucosaminyl deacetylase